jgi:hypothetical protein
MSYTPTGPIAKTLDLSAKLLGTLTAGQDFLRVASQAAALKRIVPGDGGFIVGEAGGWDGTRFACGAPAMILEAQSPEYEQVSLNSWRVTHQIDLHLIHDLVDSDSAVDAYLRAWDEHSAIQTGLRAAIPTSLVADGILTAQAPVVFGSTAPPALQRHYLSTLSIRYTKGQP